jgi:SAM-dependent methyltransferase
MQFRNGIPTLGELSSLLTDPVYRKHTEFNRQFLSRHASAMDKYGKHWGLDPYKLWSRRYEYPYVASQVIEFAEKQPPKPLRILDAGSGVTYFDYFLVQQLPQAEVICVDYDESYIPMFSEINRTEPEQPPRVSFVKSAMQSLPLEPGSIDVICCISVLEHTDNYGVIVDEFARVTRPGSALVLTFDLSLDGRHQIPKSQAVDLLRSVRRYFAPPQGEDWEVELDKMDKPGDLLTTDYIRSTNPELLPWTMPARAVKAVQDLVKGYGWTGGFRSKTIFCLTALRV